MGESLSYQLEKRMNHLCCTHIFIIQLQSNYHRNRIISSRLFFAVDFSVTFSVPLSVPLSLTSVTFSVTSGFQTSPTGRICPSLSILSSSHTNFHKIHCIDSNICLNSSSVGKYSLYLDANICLPSFSTEYFTIASLFCEQRMIPRVGLSSSFRYRASNMRM